MKKTITTIVITTLFLLKAGVSFADIPVITDKYIHKENGRKVLFGLLEPRFSIIDTWSETKLETNLYGDRYYHKIWHITCKEPGESKCRLSVSDRSSFNYGGTSFSEDIFINTENAMMDDIDRGLNRGIFAGKATKKVCIKGSNGKSFVFLFTATWQNGNENGDADIHIAVSDITNQMIVTTGNTNNNCAIIR